VGQHGRQVEFRRAELDAERAEMADLVEGMICHLAENFCGGLKIELISALVRVLDTQARLPALPPISFCLYWRADASHESAMKVRHLIAPH